MYTSDLWTVFVNRDQFIERRYIDSVGFPGHLCYGSIIIFSGMKISLLVNSDEVS